MAESLPLRRRVYRELFASAREDGKLTVTNRIIVALILVSVTLAIVGTERDFVRGNPGLFRWAEFTFGLAFLVEYAARFWAAAEQPGPGGPWSKRFVWARSVFALIDLAVVIAALFPFVVTGAPVLRLLRLLRLAALLRFGRFSVALRELQGAVVQRRYDLFVTGALAMVLLLGGATALHWAEGSVQPDAFGSIPRSMWWSIITLTTVGYGDVSPITPLGKVLAAMVALGGIGLVAMPTGIIAAAFSDAMQRVREREASGGNDS